MRDKGAEYKINWGINLADLRQMAAEYGKDYELAIELWKEDTRECKIMATLIMPADKMLPEIADLWMEQTRSQEIAELAAFNLYQHLDYAPLLAYQWIASENDIRQICGFHLLSRLFAKSQEPNERGINEFLDQALTALRSENSGVRHAALNCIRRFADMDEAFEKVAQAALKQLGFTDLL